MSKDTPPPQPADGLPTTAQTAALMGQLMKQSATDQKLLSMIVNELITTAITDKTIRQEWENITVRKGEAVFTNNVMITRAGMIRISMVVARNVKALAYVNNIGGYLNSAADIKESCLYVFDVPLNPNDAFNLSLDFDDSQNLTAVIKFVRLQEVR